MRLWVVEWFDWCVVIVFGCVMLSDAVELMVV